MISQRRVAAMNDADTREVQRSNLQFERTTRHGAELWSAPAVKETRTGDDDFKTSSYFYRAMAVEELDAFRTTDQFLQAAGHGGWAPYRAYSLEYLDVRESANPKINRLVQVYALEFVALMAAEGWFVGKLEAGCISWGTGTAQSNGWRGGGGVRPARKADARHPYDLFHEAIRGYRVVNVLTAS
jgi:hypothetical protein